ncbi:MAG: 16S rRNA (guanine(966)-N(2))-methyltransferase RsmD [Ruminococcaceae bacterium]|nr:16S rRNA (guanine(966)-N(2))-methyltransferase RsmD [Oscillospiraceae bacterium]
MRVITGSARGRKLITLEGDDVRPTTDIVKEAMFSIIQFEIEGSKVLDLFGGCGQLAIEALSRGAENAVIVDSSKKSIDIIRKNLEATGFDKKAAVVNSDAVAFLSRRTEKYDIALLDPPYSKGILEKALEKIPDVMTETGVIICEAPFNDILPERVGIFELKKKYRYGKTGLFLYRIPEKEED